MNLKIVSVAILACPNSTWLWTKIHHCLFWIWVRIRGQANSKDMRPLSILSIFWRAWSATWAKCDKFAEFIASNLPPNLTFAAKGSYGTECLAAISDHEFSRLGYGASLDFTSCFDLVDLSSFGNAIIPALPVGLQSWAQLLLGHWENLQRWVSTSGHVLAHPIKTSVGIPRWCCVTYHISSFSLGGLLHCEWCSSTSWWIILHGGLHGW